MVTVGYIKKENGIDYWYTLSNNSISPHTHKGAEGVLRHKMVKCKASSMLALFEDFLLIDQDIEDPGKDVHTYKEKIKSIMKFIEWGHENYDTLTESIIDNAFIMSKAMKSIIKLISPDNEDLKKLIFIHHTVTLTYKEPYNI